MASSMCATTPLSLSSSLRTNLSSSRTSRAPLISLRVSPIFQALSFKSVRTNFKNPISASASASARMAGQNKKIEKFETEEEVAVRLAKYTADLSAKFVKERGAFTVVLSGGSLIDALRSQKLIFIVVFYLLSFYYLFILWRRFVYVFCVWVFCYFVGFTGN